jgi:hypothetical protein
MFAPMTPMTERTRIHNEQLLSERRTATFALPKMHITTPLRKLFSTRRPAMQRQSRTSAEVYGC